MKLTAMLVDDEINIVRNLNTIIPWDEMGIEVIGFESNGLKALEKIEQTRPDLVLCDIRMPVMDGIGLLEQINKRKLDCSVIMLTGFQEFDYARSAIKFGAKDYILKPINYEELEQVVRKLAAQIRDKRLKQLQEQRQWNRVKHVAYEKLLFDILLDYTDVPAKPFAFDEDYNLETLEFTLLLVDMDSYSQISRYWGEKERKLRNFAVRNVLQEVLLPEHLDYSVLQTREGEWCILVQHEIGTPFDAKITSRWSKQLQDAVRENVRLSVSVGMYPQHVLTSELAEAYKQLRKMLHMAPVKERIIMMEKGTEKNELNHSLWVLVEEIVSNLKRRDQEKMEEAFAAFNSTLQAISEQSFTRVEQILHFLILHLIREMREIGILDDEQEEAVWRKMEFSRSVKGLFSTIQQLIEDCMHSSMNRKPSEMLMLSAKDFIDKHLADDFGVEEISDHLGISCSYFSLLFKQHYNETFLEYLTRQRMELAKSLLVMTDKSITQIGKRAGYSERRYFTRVFYKYTGMTPTEYRDRHIEISEKKG